MMETGAGQPPRSMSAQAPAQVRDVAARRTAWPNGLWGMALFLCSEVTIFGTLISTYFYLDFDARRWPPAGIQPPELAWPLIATGWLVATALPMWVASRAARRGDRALTSWMIALAFLMQCGYVAAQVILFAHDLDKFSPQATAYGSIYFTLLAVHHAHVLLGLLLDVGILWQVATRGLTNYWLIGVRGLALYWYVVGAVAIFVVFTQLTPAL
jgi:heme/copper-type cytochrome/quinol oxidase subunit 3